MHMHIAHSWLNLRCTHGYGVLGRRMCIVHVHDEKTPVSETLVTRARPHNAIT